MTRFLMAMSAVCLVVATAAPAFADDQPSARDIQAAVDSYLADSNQDVNLVGGPGSAGYDSGFWIKGGDFSLKINLTLQARFEGWRWAAGAGALGAQAAGGGPNGRRDHGSGFSLPRATMKFSGTAPCNISYYMELEFGHWGQDRVNPTGAAVNNALGPLQQSLNFDSTREAWIQWSMSELLNIRMGQVKTPSTRQLMVAPEMQQFVDISLASAYMGSISPGYTDRNRDHGIALHGTLDDAKALSYLFTITNGDGGDSIRNVIDARTSDNLQFGLRLNYAFLNPIGYQEGALRQKTCQWYGELGLWGTFYADRINLPQARGSNSFRAGGDVAVGYGGLSFTAALNFGGDSQAGAATLTHLAWLVQIGYHFPGTAWEIAARVDQYTQTNNTGFVNTPAVGGALASQHPLNAGGGVGVVREFAFGVNYYLNGHGNKMQLDVAIVNSGSSFGRLLFDPYAGYPGSGVTVGAVAGGGALGVLVRFQWQLAL